MKKRQINRVVIVEVICALFVMLFFYAALSKLKDFENFKVQLGKSPVLNLFAGIVAWIVPITELLICFFLIIKRFQYIALYAAFSLMVMFSAYIVVILNYSSYIPCSCGGILENMTWSQHLYFNIGFVTLAIVGVLIYPNKKKELIGR
jgi:uncharacterized membrane protein YphA (DoxX/SURF4 family)